MPANDTSRHRQTPDKDPLPEPMDDAASIHSRHALKTFRNGAPASKDGSPQSSQITMPDGTDGNCTANATAATGTNGAAISEQEAREWRQYRNRTLLKAAIQFTVLLLVCAGLLALTLYFVLPTIDEADRPALKIPRSFEQLKALNAVLQRYKDEYFFRVMFCWVVIYMFLQAFSVPGSMYMSIIAGAMWGVPLALPIVCASVATGATICYLISAYLGTVLVAMPKWKARVDAWGEVLAQHNDNMLSYLIVIRMMPLPPHNVVNILAPHLGIGIPIFWISTFIGIFAVSMIHVTIGEKLDQMTSADDFHLFSVRNALLLGGVILAVLTPVFVKRYSRAAQSPLEESTGNGRIRLDDDETNDVNRNSYADSDEDQDELPPHVRRLQGAQGLHNGGAADGEDEEDRAAYVARAWRGVEIDADQHSDGEGGALSDNEYGASNVFEDRREQASRSRGASRKAQRVLGTQSASQHDTYVNRTRNWLNSTLGR